MRYFLVILFLIVSAELHSQCSTAINSFPYQQGFEGSDGGWITSGNASSWEWGTPAKSIISAAATGIKCWTTGGLNGPGYNNAENSSLQSPCFDFSSLTAPEISFNVFWETEKGFDGARLEYSIDGASSWQTVGNASSAADPCLSKNWYNDPSVRFLGSSLGWAGSTGTSCPSSNGSGGWLPAKHSLPFLAGRPNVIFRFVFAAGTQCNNFDGFAVDDIYISNAVLPPVQLGFACQAGKKVDFSAVGSCIDSVKWNFADPASGGANLASGLNPSHRFTSAGPYTVTAVVYFKNGSVFNGTLNVFILSITASVTDSVKCSGGLGAVAAVAEQPLPALYDISWNTSPVVHSAALNNIPGGSYVVSISSASASLMVCPASDTVILIDPRPLAVSFTVTDAKCTSSNGSITANVAGGTAPFNLVWQNGNTGTVLSNLSDGIFPLTVTDKNGCTVKDTAILRRQMISLTVPLAKEQILCPGEKIILDPGVFASYQWQDGSASQQYMVTSAGDYFVMVTDENGCTGNGDVHVTADCMDIYFPSAFTPNDGDLRNKNFGPLGGLSQLRDYELRVYNRYGQLVFFSNNPYQKWDGKLKGFQEGIQSFVWQSSFVLKGKKQFRKGNLLLLR